MRRTTTLAVTCAAVLVGVLVASDPARGQSLCPVTVPASVLAQIKDPTARSAAQTVSLTPEFIASNGGAAAMIMQLQQQIAETDRWIAQEEANQRQLGPGTTLGVSLGERQRALQMQRDSRTLSIAMIDMLRCHQSSQVAPRSRPPGAVGQDTRSADAAYEAAAILAECGEANSGWKADGTIKNSKGKNAGAYTICAVSVRGTLEPRESGSTALAGGGGTATVEQLVQQQRARQEAARAAAAAVTGTPDSVPFFGTVPGPASSVPGDLRGVVSTDPSGIDRVLDDVLSGSNGAPLSNECQSSVSSNQLSLDATGRQVQLTFTVSNPTSTACMVTFSGQLRNGQSILASLPSRSVSVPPGGINADDVIALSTPVQTTVAACARIEPTKRALLQKRDELTQQRTKVRQFARDSLHSLGKLRRVVGEQDYAEALLHVKSALNGIQLGLAVFGPAAGIAERGAVSAIDAAGTCVSGELVSFSATTASCTGDPGTVDSCVEDVVKNGEVWVMKTAACMATGTAEKLGHAASVMEILDTQLQLGELIERRDRTIAAVEGVVYNLQQFADRLDRLRDSTAIIDATIGPLEALCRSPKIQFTTTDVKSMVIRP